MTPSFAYFTFSMGFLTGIVVSLLVVLFVFAKLQKAKPNKSVNGDVASSESVPKTESVGKDAGSEPPT